MQDPEDKEEAMPCCGYHQGKYAEGNECSMHATLEILATSYPYLGSNKPFKYGGVK